MDSFNRKILLSIFLLVGIFYINNFVWAGNNWEYWGSYKISKPINDG